MEMFQLRRNVGSRQQIALKNEQNDFEKKEGKKRSIPVAMENGYEKAKIPSDLLHPSRTSAAHRHHRRHHHFRRRHRRCHLYTHRHQRRHHRCYTCRYRNRHLHYVVLLFRLVFDLQIKKNFYKDSNFSVFIVVIFFLFFFFFFLLFFFIFLYCINKKDFLKSLLAFSSNTTAPPLTAI